MIIVNKYTRLYVSVLLIFLVFFSAGFCIADEQESSFELTARIMKVDLDHDRMVVAEEEIRLLSTTQNDKKVWQTRFVDAAKKDISVQRFKKKDKVFVLGKKTLSGEIEAEVIALLVSAPDKKKTSLQQQDNTPLSSPTYQEGGVWKN